MAHANALELKVCSTRRPNIASAEFVIDGRLLREHCEKAAKQSFDLVSPFGWAPPAVQLEVAERMLLRKPSALFSGRMELLVCPECTDLGCGCISAKMNRVGDYFEWSELGYENTYDPALPRIFPMRPFVVDAKQLTHLLRQHVADLT